MGTAGSFLSGWSGICIFVDVLLSVFLSEVSEKLKVFTGGITGAGVTDGGRIWGRDSDASDSSSVCFLWLFSG